MATAPRSMRAASSPRAGTASTQPGNVAQRADAVVVVEVAAKALLVGEPDAMRTTIGLRNWPALKNCSEAASPRIWSSALWT